MYVHHLCQEMRVIYSYTRVPANVGNSCMHVEHWSGQMYS